MARNLDKSVRQDPEAKMTPLTATGKGGWVSFPFTLGTIATMALASQGWSSNLTVYLIEKFNVKIIDAAQIVNIVIACTTFSPVLGAVLADSFLGCFKVIAISAFFTFLGVVFLALSALLRSTTLRPCHIIGSSSSSCETPSILRFTLLYVGIAIAAAGGSARFTVSTLGANQFDTPKDRNIFFNWFFVAAYVSTAIASTVIVYIQDNVGWSVGYGVCIASSAIGLVIFVAGNRFYRHDKPQGSPFTCLARVVVAAIRKRNVVLSTGSEDYHYDHLGLTVDGTSLLPTKSLRFFNRAALIMEGDINSDGSIARPWRLCTVQQVEDLKVLFRIFPLWSANIFLITTLAILSCFAVLQALAMDRRLGHHFTFPAASVQVIVLISSSIFLPILDRLLNPACEALTGPRPSRHQFIGVGHVMNILSMAASALVEYKRLKLAKQFELHQQHRVSAVPMSVLWLFPQLILAGIGEAFYLPAQVAFYHQEFPVVLRSTATAALALIFTISAYIATGLIDLVRRTTTWLPDNLNDGRLDYLYWVAVVIGVINFGYYLICAKLYKYQKVEKNVIKSSSNPDE